MFIEYIVVELHIFKRRKEIIKRQKLLRRGMCFSNKKMWKGVSSIYITYPRSSHLIESKLVVYITKNYWFTLLLWTLTFLFTSHFHRICLISSFMVNHKVLQPRVCKQIYFINKQKRQEAWLLKWFYSSRKLFLSEICFREFSLVEFPNDRWMKLFLLNSSWLQEITEFHPLVLPKSVSYSCICNIIWIGNILQKNHSFACPIRRTGKILMAVITCPFLLLFKENIWKNST